MINTSSKKNLNNRSPHRRSQVKSPLFKRTTTIKKMGHFHKITNKNLISNAIVKNLLAGDGWQKEREEAIQYLETSANGHFLILLRNVNNKLKFSGIYIVESGQKLTKLYTLQPMPNRVTPNMINKYYKYDMAGQSFKEIVGTKEFHHMTDAIMLKANYEKGAGMYIPERKQLIVANSPIRLRQRKV